MIPAIYSTQSLQTDIGWYKFVSKGRRLIEKGFLTVYDVEEDKEDDSDSQSNIPRELKDGEKLKIIGFSAEKHELRPPVRLTAAALIARLEDLWIWRPSTFASIIKTLIDKDYVSVEGTKQTITVTERGLYVANLLRVLAPDIVDLKFTADMENKLDMISSGKSKRMDVIKPLIQDVVFKSMTKAGIGFDSKWEKVKTWPVRISPSEKETMDKLGTIDKEPKACPNCGSDKYKFHEWWQYWPYFKCSECGLTHNVTERILDSKCPHCWKPMIRKKSKKWDIYFTCVDKEGCGHFTSVEPWTE